MGKYAVLLFLLFIITAISIQLLNLFEQKKALSSHFDDFQAQSSALLEENKKLEGEIEYLSNEENLEKELRSRFNYRRSDEKMYILVP
ncbi:MAG: septum formation initiator family protein [Candidatus Harrisonbacteria bacterium]|nr:septum formation initiator family protein [Candidatus Harrisonbacteria bacterium]